jgi:hypothetical protein
VRWSRDAAGIDSEPVDSDPDVAGRVAEPLPAGGHLALFAPNRLDVVPVNDVRFVRYC